MSLTSDPNDPRLGHGSNDTPVPQNEAYLVLSEEERAKGFVRPVRQKYYSGDPRIERVMSRNAWGDYRAEIADAKQEAERHYSSRQMRHGEDVPDENELREEDR